MNNDKREEVYELADIQQSYLYNYLMLGKRSYTYVEHKVNELQLSKFIKIWDSILEKNPLLKSKIDLNKGKIFIDTSLTSNIMNNRYDENINDSTLLKIRKKIKKIDSYKREEGLFYIEISYFNDGNIIHYLFDSMIIDGRSANTLFNELYNAYYNDDEIITCNHTFFEYVNKLKEYKSKSIYYERDLKYWGTAFKKTNHFFLPSPDAYDEKKVYVKKLDKSLIEKKLKDNKISNTVFFLEFFSNIIQKICDQNETSIILTLDKRRNFFQNVNQIIGPFTETIYHIIHARKSKANNIDNLLLCKKELINEMDHTSCNGIDVTRAIDNKTGSSVVFTYRKEKNDLNTSVTEIYQDIETANIAIECNITETKKEFIIRLFIVPSYLGWNSDDIFNLYISQIEMFSKKECMKIDRNQISLSSLQKYYLTDRIKGNHSGAIFKQYLYYSSKNKEVIVQKINDILLSYSSVRINLNSQCLEKNDQPFRVEVIEIKEQIEIQQYRKKSIDRIESNIDDRGLIINLLLYESIMILQVAADMVFFTANQFFQLLMQIFSVFREERKCIKYMKKNTEDRFYSRNLFFGMDKLFIKQCMRYNVDYIDALELLITFLLKKMCIISTNIITIISYNNENIKYEDRTKISYKKIGLENDNIVANIKDDHTNFEISSKEIELVFTECKSINFHNTYEEDEHFSYASTTGVDIDCLIYKKNDTTMLEFNVKKEFIDETLFDLFIIELRNLLKNYSLLDKRWLENMNKEEIIYRNILDNFQNNNNNSLTFTDYKKLVYDWNETNVPFSSSMLIQDCFLESVRRFPNNIALKTNGHEISYKELDDKSNLIAEYIVKNVKEDIIGIYMDRNEYLIITLLGILKAGKAYLPLNISDPIERVYTILEEAQVYTIAVNNEYKNIFSDTNYNTICGEECCIKLDGFNNDLFEINKVKSSDDLAYVLYTSGSTGKPKGVAVTHKAVINLFEWCKSKYNFSEKDAVLCVNPLNFDLSVFDIFGFLSFGGTIHLLNEEDRKNPFSIIDILKFENITFWNSAPAYMNLLLPIFRTNRDVINSLRLIFLSGDWIPLSMPNETKKYFPKSQFVSLGGATEATVWSNYYEVENIDPEWKSIPYGKPIQNCMYYILDENLNPCKIGEQGDLYISGECLSMGYYNNNKLTNEFFISNPFSEKYKIMYKTGDLAKYFEDGNIEFLGRSDTQIKLRGYRIELGEIESALKQCMNCNCIAWVDNERIIACLESQSLSGEDKHDILEKLKNRLSSYMIPSEIVTMEKFPITENGKWNRKKIIAVMQEDKEEIISTLDNVEKSELEKIILEVLDCKKLPSIYLSDLSLNSLQLTLLSAKINEKYQVKINPTLFYKFTTILDIKQYIDDFILQEKKKCNKDDTLINLVQDICNDYKEPINFTTKFNELNMNSLQISLLCSRILEKFDKKINPTLIFKYENIGNLYDDIMDNRDNMVIQKEKHENTEIGNSVVIIGIDYNFPKAKNSNDFEDTVINGLNAARQIPSDRWDVSKINKKYNVNSNYASLIDNIDEFDPKFFKISPREAKLMDPRQRLLLESTWKLIEKSGYSKEYLSGKKIGVFIAATGDEYYNLCRENNIDLSELSLSGTSKTLLANRISYFFDWHGPSEVIDTACSSSLVALHHATEALKNNECEMALVGGINIIIDPLPHVSLEKVGMLSKDGKCKTFSSTADGYGRGEGYGLILLKKEKDAIKDNDKIYVKILSTFTNHGGKANALTAPNPKAQTDLIYGALAKGNVDLNDFRYIECHGTGTQLGDPIEIEGIKDAVIQYANNFNYSLNKKIYLGSVKSCIGHLEAAAGIASIIKTIICMDKNIIPKNPLYGDINEKIDLSDTNLIIPSNQINWDDKRKIAGVSSFGFGGTNAHIILEKEENKEKSIVHHSDIVSNIICFSAPARDKLQDLVLDVYNYLSSNNKYSIQDIAYTLSRRTEFEERVAFVVDSKEILLDRMKEYLEMEKQINNLYYGNVRKDQEITSNIKLVDDDGMSNHDLAQLWCWGKIKLSTLNYNGRLITSLPIVSFSNKRFWFDKFKEKEIINKIGILNIGTDNVVVNNHIINNEQIVPAALYIEYILKIYKTIPLKIKDIVWQNVISEHMLPVKLDIYDTEFVLNNKVMCSFKISESKSEKRVIDSYETGCEFFSKEKVYKLFENKGIAYGNLFKVINKAYVGDKKVIAYLEEYLLDTLYFDAMFQTAMLLNNDTSPDIFLPFTVNEINVYGYIKNGKKIVCEKKSINNKIILYNIYLLDNHNQIICEFKNYSGIKQKSKNHELFYEKYQPITYNKTIRKEENIFAYLPSEHGKFISLNKEQLNSLIIDSRFDYYNLVYIYRNHISPTKFFRNIFDLCKYVNEKDCKINLLIVQEDRNDLNSCYISSIIGFANSIKKENDNINIKLLNMSSIDIDCIYDLYANLVELKQNEFRYDVVNKQLYVKNILKYRGRYSLREIRNQGIYVLIGGGTISKKIAHKIKLNGGIPIILSRKKVNEYNSYVLDVRNYDLLSSVFKDIIKKYQIIDGIFNLAAITKDRFFYFKKYEEFLEVLNTKVLTTFNIIKCIYDNKIFIDFLVNFSSLVSIFGNKGQTDYAMANRFLDNVSYLKLSNIKKIRTINWPYWKDGGMQLSDDKITEMIEEIKQYPISDKDAFNVLFDLEANELMGNEIILDKNTDL